MVQYSDITTNSMYASHIITGAGFGGMVCFNDKKLYDKAKLLRGWGRSSAVFLMSQKGYTRDLVQRLMVFRTTENIYFSDMGYKYNYLEKLAPQLLHWSSLKKLPTKYRYQKGTQF